MTHPSSLAFAYCFLATHACMPHNAQETRDNAEAAIELGRRHGLGSWTAMATALCGWALIEQGQESQELAQLQDGTAAFRARGFAHMIPFFLGLDATACLRMSMPEEARIAIPAAHTVTRNGRDRFWLAELHRLQGELARAESRDAGEAETHFQQAMNVARDQGAKMPELRAATSLAQLWHEQGRPQEARQVLAEVHDTFGEGFYTHDLQAAATLLKTMA